MSISISALEENIRVLRTKCNAGEFRARLQLELKRAARLFSDNPTFLREVKRALNRAIREARPDKH